MGIYFLSRCFGAILVRGRCLLKRGKGDEGIFNAFQHACFFHEMNGKRQESPSVRTHESSKHVPVIPRKCVECNCYALSDRPCAWVTEPTHSRHHDQLRNAAHRSIELQVCGISVRGRFLLSADSGRRTATQRRVLSKRFAFSPSFLRVVHGPLELHRVDQSRSFASFNIVSSSPVSSICVMMSHPPTNSPLTKTCGTVGHSV